MTRFVAQSFANARYARTRGPVKTEEAPPRKRQFPIVGAGALSAEPVGLRETAIQFSREADAIRD